MFFFEMWQGLCYLLRKELQPEVQQLAPDRPGIKHNPKEQTQARRTAQLNHWKLRVRKQENKR
jgi:hypothetical protein